MDIEATGHHAHLRRGHPLPSHISPVGRALAERIRHQGRCRCRDPELLAEVDAFEAGSV